jgi:hypothetical protein
LPVPARLLVENWRQELIKALQQGRGAHG